MDINIESFRKKCDILRYLGRAQDDTRWLDRAIKSGEVLTMNGLYISREDLIREVFRVLGICIQNYENMPNSSEELEEARANVEYYEKENEELRDKNIALESVLDSLREKGIEISRGC